jgi:transcriptional regulator with XRE-family HTH domain
MSSGSAIARLFTGPSAIAADEVRAARASLGWTLEEAADEMGVLPLEVAAWEAGTIRPTREQAAMLRWRAEVKAVEDRALGAGSITCGWVPSNAERPDRLMPGGRGDPEAVVQDARTRLWEYRTHAYQCPECQQLEAWRRQHPFPSYPGESRWMETTLVWVVLVLAPPSIAVVFSPDDFPALEPCLALFVCLGILSQVVEPTRLMAEERPVAAACLRAAAVVLPLLVLGWLRGWMGPGAPEPWASAGNIVLLGGMWLLLMFGTRTSDWPG